MTTCGTNLVQVSGCDSSTITKLLYDVTTEVLTLTTLGGDFTTSIPLAEVSISATDGNKLVSLPDGLFVYPAAFTVNGIEFTDGDTLNLTSADSSVTIVPTKVDEELTLDLSCSCSGSGGGDHDALTVTPNEAYSFDEASQALSLPLPTLIQSATDPNVFTYTANDGSGDAFVLALHTPLTVANGAPFSFNSATQALVLPIASLTEPSPGQYLYDAGDNTTTPITINVPILSKDATANIFYYTDTLNNTQLVIGAYDPTGTNLTSTDWDSAITELATTKNPWAEELGAQPTRDVDLEITDNIYRSGTVGIGTLQTDTTQGQAEVRGDVYFTNSSDEEEHVFQVGVGGTVLELVKSFISLTTVTQARWRNSVRSLMSLDSDGNLGVGEIQSQVTLPDDTYGGHSSITISNYDESLPPAVPISVYSTTTFTLIV